MAALTQGCGAADSGCLIRAEPLTQRQEDNYFIFFFRYSWLLP